MLQKLREQTQSTGFKILAGAIIVVLTLFGFGATNLFLGGEPEVASVGDVDITQSVLDNETERVRRRLLAQMGPDFDPSAIDRLALQGRVLEQLISRNVLNQTAKSLGVRVSASQTDDQIVNNPNYQVDGVFNADVYRQQLQALGYTPVAFMAEITDALSSDQLRTGLIDSDFIADWNLAETIKVLNQKRDVAYLPLTVGHFSTQVEVTDEEVATRYEEEQANYMTQLSLDVNYVAIGVDDLLNDPSISVSEDELLDIYNTEKANFALTEQRDSAHILVQINADRDEEQALALITEVYAKLNDGGDFDALAKEFSEDPGSAEQGGALGLVGKGVFDPEFEDALWGMQPGEISAPVKTTFGYHLIRLNDIAVSEYPSFDDQRAILESAERRTRALDLLDERSAELERLAYDERFSLAESARTLGLEVISAAGVNRSQQPEHEQILGRAEVLDALFSEEVLAGENSHLLEIGDDRAVIVRVEAQHPPAPIALADVAASIKEAMIREKALIAVEAAKNAALARLQAGESVTEIAKTYGQRWSTHESVSRAQTGGVPAAVHAVAFELPRPPVGEKSVGFASLPDGAALVTVTRVQQGNVNTTTDAELAQIEPLLVNRSAGVGFSSFFQAAQETIGITRRMVISEEE